MFQFLKDLYENNLELINDYRSNFVKKENLESIDFLKIDYFLNEFFVCECLWKSPSSFSISTSSISPCYISACSVSANQFPVVFMAAMLEELSDFNFVYFITSEKKLKKIIKNFCSATIIGIELDGRFKMDVVGIRGNLEENGLHKFPLIFFNY